jgi:hypothetical protein
MTTWLFRAVETVRTIHQDARVWVHHLTGEGPTTVRRQREGATQALALAPPAPSAHALSVSAKSSRPEAPTTPAVAGPRPAFIGR